MYFLAGSAFLLAFVAFASGETCNQITDCLKYVQSMKTAGESGDVAGLCPNIKKMADCFSSAVADCKTSGSNFPKATMDQFEKSMNDAKAQYEMACGAGQQGGDGGIKSSGADGGDGGMSYGGSGSEVPESASCMQSANCIFDMMKMQKALNDENLKEVCRIVTPSAKCLKSAYNDCKETKLIPKQQLNELSQQLNQMDELFDQHCAGGANGIGVSTLYMALISALALIVVRLF